jgi:hypothetical protein
VNWLAEEDCAGEECECGSFSELLRGGITRWEVF